MKKKFDAMKKMVYLVFLIAYPTFSQEGDKGKTKALEASKNLTWEANKELAENNFVNAEADYRRAISKSNENVAAPYNLGNAYYEKETYSEAFSRFKQAGELASNKSDKHRAYHNMGNVFMKNKEYQKAVEAYKEALRNNPTDEETRYNLALAKELLKKEQDEQKNDQDQDNKDQQDKDDKKDQDQKNEGDNKDDQKKDQDKDQGDKGEEEKEENKEGDGDKEEEKKKQPDKGDPSKEQKQPRPNQLSPQQVKNLLEAMQNEEKKVQEKLDAQKVKGAKVKNEKDW